MADKPTAAFVLSLIGGIFILLGGVALAIGFSFILGLSIIAFPAAWGFGIGSLLAFIGAILALVYKPSMAAGAMPPPMMSSSMPMGSAPMGSMGMTCKNCGASIPAGATRCPSCGANL